ncbi:MAG: hypothetical protein JKY00_08565 [Roseicyclus sp.]|nr:hypothetical protein [Roseicyclus sp.]
MLRSEDILSMDRDHVAAFIKEQTSAKTLSVLVRRLNEELLEGDETVRQIASRALQHLGFPEYA